MKSNLAPMGIRNLIDSLPPEYGSVERETIQRAYNYAEKAHAGQTRQSGEAYINHCVAVATILAELHLPAEAIVAGLLHDTVEDTSVTLQDLHREFGEPVKKLVDGVTKLSTMQRASKVGEASPSENGSEAQKLERISKEKREIANEALRKMFVAMGEDIRIVLIKLADRLHNMRTLNFTSPEKQRRIAQDTMDIYAPLANRLGIGHIKWELEDLAFRYTNPEKYKEIAEFLAERREAREYQIDEIVETLRVLLAENNITAEISGRPKHIYSIYKKMSAKEKSVDLLRDLRGVRLIVKDVAACYQTLGVIHMRWRPIPNEFDDYIAAPKNNNYRSLHTAITYNDGKALEVQIRTPEMHQESEYGIAAHWRYKEGGSGKKYYEERINSLRMMMDWHLGVTDANEFVEGMKSDVFKDRVYVLTPRGDIIDLPAGSTPIDFAYRVHTDIGHRCRGAKVDGKLVPLNYVLETGKQVEILASKQGGPSHDWLNENLGLVKTQSAREKIRAWFKKQKREESLARGRQMVEREFNRLGLSDVNLENLAHELNFKTADDMFVDVGATTTNTAKIVKHLAEKILPQDEEDNINIQKPSRAPTDAVTVLGLKGMLSTIAGCCNPAPGDPIAGYVTRGRGTTIHRADCPNFLRLQMIDRERIMQINRGEKVQTYPVPIRITAFDRQGLMVDITNMISNEGLNITDVGVQMKKDKFQGDVAELHFVIEVQNLEQLSGLLNRIESLPNVLEAHRVRAG